MARCLEYVYGTCLFYLCCSDCVGSVCCVAPLLTIVVLALECGSMLYVCVRGVMDVVFSVCIVTRGAIGARL